MPLIASSTAMVLPGSQAELGRRLRRGVLGHLELAVELELAGFELLEQHVERHDLGERSRMPQRVGIGLNAARRRNWHRPRSLRKARQWLERLDSVRTATAEAKPNIPQRSPRGAPVRIRSMVFPPSSFPLNAPSGASTPLSCRGTGDWTCQKRRFSEFFPAFWRPSRSSFQAFGRQLDRTVIRTAQPRR